MSYVWRLASTSPRVTNNIGVAITRPVAQWNIVLTKYSSLLGFVNELAVNVRGHILVEKVFSWPGIGSFAIEALIASDYAAVQGFVLSMALLFVTVNLTIDVILAITDPRVGLEE